MNAAVMYGIPSAALVCLFLFVGWQLRRRGRKPPDNSVEGIQRRLEQEGDQ